MTTCAATCHARAAPLSDYGDDGHGGVTCGPSCPTTRLRVSRTLAMSESSREFEPPSPAPAPLPQPELPSPEPAPMPMPQPEPELSSSSTRLGLQRRIDAWLEEVGIGHGGAETSTRRFDPTEFVHFARQERLHRCSCDTIYRKYIDAKILAPLSLAELDIVIDEICDEIGDRIDELVCPITLEIMTSPVVAADGRTYERSAIEDWLSTGKQTSPLTNLPLEHTELRPNEALQAMLSKFKAWDDSAASVNPGDNLQIPLEQAVLEKARALLANVESLQADLARVIPGDTNAAKLAAEWACEIQELVEPYTVA
jgi:hypothetical protein